MHKFVSVVAMYSIQLVLFMNRKSSRKRNIALFLLIVPVWLIVDRLTKSHFSSNYELGEIISEPIMGLFRFHLAHNTVAAWGIFSDSTFALAIVSSVVCVLVIGFFLINSKTLNVAESVGLSLILSGGIGNAIDRFANGYVVDFIEFTFIDFPIFNVADMGVVCGFILLLLGLIVSFTRSGSDKEVQGEQVLQSEDSSGSASATSSVSDASDADFFADSGSDFEPESGSRSGSGD